MPHWLYVLLTVPGVSAFIGWLTNWQAVKMIFWPEKPLGIGAAAWQGIVFRHADTFATNLGRIARDDLLSGPEIVDRIDPARVQRVVANVLEREAPHWVAEVAELVKPGAWTLLPDPVREQIVAQVMARSLAVATSVTADLQGIALRHLDVQELVRRQLSGANVRRLARLTEQIGHKEFRFIEWSGGLFGAIIGFAQIGVWESMQVWWVMPIFGVVVGLVTNWLAIQMIFRPYERTRVLGVIPYQGLFPKRQREIARDYGQTTADEVITAKNLVDFLTTGEVGKRVAAELDTLIQERTRREWDAVGGLLPFAVDAAVEEKVRLHLAGRMAELFPTLRRDLEPILDNQLDVRRTVESRLAALSKPEFERLLRGVFQEDELTLIVVGGVLGGLVGCVQAAFMLAG